MTEQNKIELSQEIWKSLNLSEDWDFVRLRRKYYGGGNEIKFGGEEPGPSGYWQKVHGRAGPVPMTFLRPVIGWEKGWARSGEATVDDWSNTFNEVCRRADWHLMQSPGHSAHERDRIKQALERSQIPFLLRTDRSWILQGVPSWDSYFKSNTENFRDQFKKAMTKAEKNGLQAKSEISESDLRTLFSRRKLDPSVSDYTKESVFLDFISEWLTVLKSQNRLSQVGVYSGDRLIGMAMGFWRGKTFFFYQTAYDHAFEKLSPGRMAFYRLMEETLNQGTDLFTFMNSFEYTKRYTPKFYEFHRFDIFSGNGRSKLIRAGLQLRERLRAGSWRT